MVLHLTLLILITHPFPFFSLRYLVCYTPFYLFGWIVSVNLLISHMPALFVSSATYRTLYYYLGHH